MAARLFAHAAFVEARTLLLTMPIGSEIDTRAIVEHCRHVGKQLVLPRVVRGHPMLQLKRVSALEGLVAGVWGILEPTAEALTVEPCDLDFILAPGLAFDRACNRLGYGGGYFDRLLAQLTPRTHVGALAYDCQIIESVPHAAHDLPVQFVITPSEIITRSP